MKDKAPLTSGETYFFRDHGQIDLLRLSLLPDLIERRRRTKKLRLWSAGCATGEEVYSLAILVDMLLPKRDDWDILILGSDSNQTALAKAERGSYGQWSFRMVSPTLRQRYFKKDGDRYQLDEHIRSMVTFQAGNLINDHFPGRNLVDMDLILCRNVFIYFTPEAVIRVANKLAATLSPDGYLMTGHTELIGHRLPDLRSRLFAESVVYQRRSLLTVEHSSFDPVQTRPPVLENGVPVSAVTPPASCVVKPAGNIASLLTGATTDDLLKTAHDLADQGEYERAEQTCYQVLTVTPMVAGAHFLLAQLAQLKGDFRRAGELLDKTLYLDPLCVAAYLEKAALCERGAHLERAQTLRRAALNIVRTLPGDTVIEPYGSTAAELSKWLEP